MARPGGIVILLVLMSSEASERAFGLQGESHTLDTLMECVLVTDRCRDQLTVFREFSRTPDAPGAIPLLIQAMEREAPRLDNNACLLIEMIATSHPGAEIPIDPLLAAVRRKAWTSRQKCAQALERALTPALIRDREEELVRVLLPLLVSQRSRVFEAGARCLEKIAGYSFGADPERWLGYYEERFKEPIDLSEAFHEWVVVVDRLEDGRYRIDEAVYADDPTLVEALLGLQAALSDRDLTLAVVVRATEEEISRMLGGPNNRPRFLGPLGRLLQLLMVENSMPPTLAPPEDVFRPPHDLLKARLTR
jgi:hypothetical protein